MGPDLVPVIAIITIGVVVVMKTFGVELLRRLPRRELKEGSPHDRAELEGIHDAIADMNGRLDRVEEERAFYKDLLATPGTRREIPPPAVEEDASDTGPA